MPNPEPLGLTRAGAGALAEHVSLQPELWLAIVFNLDQREAGIAQLSEELQSIDGSEDRPCMRIEAATAHRLFDVALQQPIDAILLVTGIEQFATPSLLALDRGRNSLLGRTILFCTNESGIQQLATQCPNIYSWLGGECYLFDPSEGVMDAEERLVSLRTHYRLLDAQVVELAEKNELPSDPAFVEWLALLGRGDLLGS